MVENEIVWFKRFGIVQNYNKTAAFYFYEKFSLEVKLKTLSSKNGL